MPVPRLCLPLVVLSVGLAACGAPGRLEAGQSLPLASLSQNYVEVRVSLEIDSDAETWLTATYTPLDAGAHLYALDLPPDGVNGVGRPTRLELPPGSPLQALGPPTALVEAAAQDSFFSDLRVYPPGPVTLRLPVILPPGAAWVEAQVSVTYMACKGNACRPPVIHGLIPVRVPGADLIGP